MSTLVLSVRGSFSADGVGDVESPPSFIMAKRLKLWCDDDVFNGAAGASAALSVDLTSGTEIDLEVVGDLANDVDLVHLADAANCWLVNSNDWIAFAVVCPEDWPVASAAVTFDDLLVALAADNFADLWVAWAADSEDTHLDAADFADVRAAETPPPLHKPEAATLVAVDCDPADVTCAGVTDGAVDVPDDSDEKNEANDENESDDEDAADDDDGANDIERSAQLLLRLARMRLRGHHNPVRAPLRRAHRLFQSPRATHSAPFRRPRGNRQRGAVGLERR